MNIIYEDNHLIAIHKQAGLLTHSDKTGDICATEQVKAYIKEQYNKPGAVFLNPVHRLDRPVSGLLLFARTSKATTRMTVAFKAKETTKTYIAVSNKQPAQPKGRLTHYLLKNGTINTTKVVRDSNKGGKLSILDYELIGTNKHGYVLKVMPQTGRSHQIRVQLAAMGCPIIGDLKYGSTIKTDGRSILLHAYQLAFIHPVRKEPLQLQCNLPNNEFWKKFQPFVQDI